MKLWSFGIEEVLRDPVGLREFELFLEKEFSSENIKFWLAVKKLKSLPQSQVEIHALNIYRSVLFQGFPVLRSVVSNLVWPWASP